jgi:hypothetical protein
VLKRSKQNGDLILPPQGFGMGSKKITPVEDGSILPLAGLMNFIWHLFGI